MSLPLALASPAARKRRRRSVIARIGALPVPDLMRERAAEIATLLKDANSYIYVCGLKGMEAGVLEVLRDTAIASGMDWPTLHAELKRDGRLHLETY